MFEKKSLNIYSVIVGMLFIISGFGKAIDTAGFSTLISQYGLGYLTVLSPLIIVFEILLGILLVLLINPRFFAMISFFVLTIFTALFAFAHFKYGINDCGCFGTVQHLNFPPFVSFIRNIILIAMSGMIWWGYPKTKMIIVAWKKYTIISLVGISIFLTGLTTTAPLMSMRIGKISEPSENNLQKQNVQNTEFAKYIITSADKTYLFFCFSYSCSYCWNSIENLRSFIRNNIVDSVMIFGSGEEKDRLIFEETFKPDFPIINLSPEKMSELLSVYPTAFYVQNNTIKDIIPGELSSPFIFRNKYILK